MKEPITDHRHPDYQLDLGMPDFCVVLSPCCSIGGSTITLVQLEPVINKFFTNPYFASDLTRINRRVAPEDVLRPQDWEGLSEEERLKKINEGNAYVFVEWFIYAENDILPRYPLRLRGQEFETGCYMIDFRKSFRVYCPRIVSAENSPIEAKLLQLTAETRQELRDKISKYFSREPLEDIAAMQAS